MCIRDRYQAMDLPSATSTETAPRTCATETAPSTENPSRVSGLLFTLFTNAGQPTLYPALVVLVHPEDLDASNPMLEPSPKFQQLLQTRSEEDMLKYVTDMQTSESNMQQFLLDPLAIFADDEPWIKIKFCRVRTTWPALCNKIKKTASKESKSKDKQLILGGGPTTAEPNPTITSKNNRKATEQTVEADEDLHPTAATRDTATPDNTTLNRNLDSESATSTTPKATDTQMMVMKLTISNKSLQRPEMNRGYEKRMARLLIAMMSKPEYITITTAAHSMMPTLGSVWLVDPATHVSQINTPTFKLLKQHLSFLCTLRVKCTMAMDTQVKDFQFYNLYGCAIHESGRPAAQLADTWMTVVMWNPYTHNKANILGKNTIMERGISIDYNTQTISEADSTVTPVSYTHLTLPTICSV